MNSGESSLQWAEHLGLVTPQKPRPSVGTLREPEAAGYTLDMDVDVDQQLQIDSAGGDSIPDVPLPDVTLPDVALPDVSLPDIPLPDVPLPEARPDGSEGEE